MARATTAEDLYLIYEPDSLHEDSLLSLESALEKDRGRILYMGSDGSKNYVIVQASSFKNTRAWSDGAGVPLVIQRSADALSSPAGQRRSGQ